MKSFKKYPFDSKYWRKSEFSVYEPDACFTIQMCIHVYLLILLFLNTTNVFAYFKTNKAFTKLDHNGILNLMMQWQTLREFFFFQCWEIFNFIVFWLLEILLSANSLSVVNMFNDI